MIKKPQFNTGEVLVRQVYNSIGYESILIEEWIKTVIQHT